MGRKTLIEIDEALLDEARQVLGAKTIKETVNGSLREVVALAARRRDVERLLGTDFDPDDRPDAWR
jgi:Arc/MetJ family transcription regulator